MGRREEEKKRLENYPCPDKDGFETSGVLLSNEIEHYATEYKMIEPFTRENLKPAAYELTVGYEYSKGGKSYELSDKTGKDTIEIPPFEVVIIRTRETINLSK